MKNGIQYKRLLGMIVFFTGLVVTNWSFGAPVEIFQSSFSSGVSEGSSYSRFAEFGELKSGTYKLTVVNRGKQFESSWIDMYVDGFGNGASNEFMRVTQEDNDVMSMSFHLSEGNYFLSLFGEKMSGNAFSFLTISLMQLSIDGQNTSPVPLPASIVLLIAGCFVLLGLRKRNTGLV